MTAPPPLNTKTRAAISRRRPQKRGGQRERQITAPPQRVGGAGGRQHGGLHGRRPRRATAGRAGAKSGGQKAGSGAKSGGEPPDGAARAQPTGGRTTAPPTRRIGILKYLEYSNIGNYSYPNNN